MLAESQSLALTRQSIATKLPLSRLNDTLTSLLVSLTTLNEKTGAFAALAITPVFANATADIMPSSITTVKMTAVNLIFLSLTI